MSRTNSLWTGITAVLLVLAAAESHAEVTASGPSGFSLKIELPVTVAPTEAFRRFLEIGQWWNSEHTYSGKSANLRLESKAGGCFCETLPDGGFVKHMDVVYSAPGKVLRLAGGLGPLQGMGATGIMGFQFKPEGATTRIILTYTVSGFGTGKGLAEVALPVEGVLTEQLTRFKRFAETGKPAA